MYLLHTVNHPTQEYFVSPVAAGTKSRVDDDFPMIRNMFVNKKTCYDRYNVRWESDPNIRRETDIVVNPFAKHPNSHCRDQNSQCASGKCNQWYCM